MGVDYTILSKPSSIKFDCPHCGEKEVELGDYEYD